MNEKQSIDQTISFVKETLKGAEGGHDWFHIERVYRNALLIMKSEKANKFVVSLAALLHDIADPKFHNGDEKIGPKMSAEFLMSINVSSVVIEHVIQIIKHISFKSNIGTKSSFNSPEFEIVQDADRLDAIGAIGIARCFNYGGFKNRAIYDPSIKPNLNMSKEEYKSSTAPTINHFYEKLMRLKELMNTKTGKKIAEERHRFMENYLKQFFSEINGKK